LLENTIFMLRNGLGEIVSFHGTVEKVGKVSLQPVSWIHAG